MVRLITNVASVTFTTSKHVQVSTVRRNGGIACSRTGCRSFRRATSSLVERLCISMLSLVVDLLLFRKQARTVSDLILSTFSNVTCLYDLHLSSFWYADRWDVELKILQPIYDRTTTHCLQFVGRLGEVHLWSGRSPMTVHHRSVASVHESFTPLWRDPITAHFLSKYPCREVPDGRTSHAVISVIRRNQTWRSHLLQLRGLLPPEIHMGQSTLKACEHRSGVSLPDIDTVSERPCRPWVPSQPKICAGVVGVYSTFMARRGKRLEK